MSQIPELRRIFLVMKSLVLLALLFGSTILAAEIKPVDPRTPIFRIYVAFTAPSQERTVAGPQVTFDPKHPLLVVWSARDVRLTPDRNGVIFVLNEKDTKTFAAASRKFDRGLLLVEGQGSVLSAMQITEPLNNGEFEFKNPDDAKVVQYLRRRFNLPGPR